MTARTSPTEKLPRRRFLAGTAAASLAAVTRSRPAAAARAEQPKYRVGVIGHTGRGNYGHGLDRVWLEVPGTKIVAVADADPAAHAAAGAHLDRSRRAALQGPVDLGHDVRRRPVEHPP